MKILSSLIITLVLSITVKLSHSTNAAIKLQCKYEISSYNSREYYACYVIDLENHQNNTIVNEIIGIHLNDKNDNDVEAVIIKNQNATHLPSGVGKKFKNLVILEVTNSQLKEVKKENFADMNLETLKLRKNSIEALNVDVFEDLTYLTELNLDDNKISFLPDEIFKNTKLEILSINNNQLTTLHPKFFENLPNLKEISMKNNTFETLPEILFENNENLESVDLSENNLTAINFKIFENVKKFDLTGSLCLSDYEKFTHNTTINDDVIENCSYDENTLFKALLKKLEKKITKNAEIHGLIENIKSDFQDKLDKIMKLTEENDKLKTSLNETEIKLNTCEDDKSKVSDKLKNVDQQYENATKHLDIIINELKSCESKSSNFSVDLHDCQQKSFNLTENLSNCMETSSKLTACLEYNFNFMLSANETSQKIQQLENNQKKLTEENAELKKLNENLNNDLTKKSGELKGNVSECQLKNQNLEASNSNLTKNIEDLSKNATECKKLISEREELKNKSDEKSSKITIDLQTCEQKINVLESEKKTRENIFKISEANCKDTHHESLRNLQNCQQNATECKKNLDYRENELKNAQNDSKMSQNDFSSCKSNLDDLNDKIDHQRRSFERDLSNSQREVEDNLNKLNSCKQAYESLQQLSSNQINEIQDLTSQNVDLQASYGELTNKNAEISALQLDRDDLEYKLNDCNIRLTSAECNCPDFANCCTELDEYKKIPLTCDFLILEYQYTCRSSILIVNHRSMEISETHGNHMNASFENSHVEKLQIINSVYKYHTNDIFNHFIALKSLEIINSQFSDLENQRIESNLLKNLRIENNLIQNVPNDAFIGCKNLDILILINNSIEIIHERAFSGLNELQKLDLKKNKILSLHQDIFGNLQQLTHLSIADNRLEYLQGNLLMRQKNLRVVNFSGNVRLMSIGRDLLKNAVKLQNADFTGTCVGNNSFKGIEEINLRIKSYCGF